MLVAELTGSISQIVVWYVWSITEQHCLLISKGNRRLKLVSMSQMVSLKSSEALSVSRDRMSQFRVWKMFLILSPFDNLAGNTILMCFIKSFPLHRDLKKD